LGTLAVAYLAELQALGKAQEGTAGWSRGLLWIIVFVSSLPLMAAGIFDTQWMLSIGVSTAMLAVLSRQAALLYMQQGDQLTLSLRGLLRRLRPSVPNRFLRSTSRNAIEYRSMATVAGRVPGGLAGALAWRFSGLLLGALVLLIPEAWMPLEIRRFFAIEIVGMMYVVNLASTCWRQVQRDRPHMGMLGTTALSSTEYVNGMVRAATLPRLWETALSLTLVVLVGDLGHSSAHLHMSAFDCGGMGLGMLFCVPVVAYGTTYLAIRCKSILEAMLRFYVGGFLIEAIAFLPGFLMAAVSPAFGLALALPWFLVVYVGLIGIARSWAIGHVEKAFAPAET
jgi:hypothetical protein